ncbi:hypothetical protein AK973_3516 [Pseudomonas brassicacearum]|nr:hypothetical protein AK973_3516 [Pseudomonas brassicacearum]
MGASLLAMATVQAPLTQAGPPLSRASSLPYWFGDSSLHLRPDISLNKGEPAA